MPAHAVIDLAGVQALLDVLRERGFTVLGPTVRDGAVVPAPISSVADLPRGWGDEQDGAHYRLRRRDDDALFGFAAGAQSWKPVLFPAEQVLWRGRRTDDGFTVDPPGDGDRRWGSPPYALLGVRSCDLHAIGIHDQVLLARSTPDSHYAAERQDAFIVAVACSDPGGTCFCVSMRTGPRPESGFDLSLTELSTGDNDHRLLVEVGSDRGAEVLAALPHLLATTDDLAASSRVTHEAESRMGRSLDTAGLKDVLYAAAESPRWDDVAARCLACGNCTMVCPTCFCTSVEDHTDLTGQVADRSRVWDSCFTGQFSQLHGGSVRASVRSRYRQWATHKLASWEDQFGMSGCVGCGRCITWCPAAIDITEEAAAIRSADPAVPDVSGD
ncbi:MAG: 4Fe-4S dicluster domain-containing protein [Actinomycetes bacterium]